jgi:hypothetical protein
VIGKLKRKTRFNSLSGVVNLVDVDIGCKLRGLTGLLFADLDELCIDF